MYPTVLMALWHLMALTLFKIYESALYIKELIKKPELLIKVALSSAEKSSRLVAQIFISENMSARATKI